MKTEMNRMNNKLAVFFLGLALTSFGQTNIETHKEPTFNVLAKFIAFNGGDKLHSATFKVLKCLNDSIKLKDTITVWYYNYLQPDTNLGNVLLTLNRYDRQSQVIKDNLHCAENNGKTGITNAKIEFIDFDYWEKCETGKGECKTINFGRPQAGTNWFLIMPCGGTETAITISGQNFYKDLHFFHDCCPPYLELTNLNDGQYTANMSACGLGGSVSFHLTTTN